MVLGMCNMTVGGVKGGFVEVFSSESLLCIAWHFLDLIIKIKKIAWNHLIADLFIPQMVNFAVHYNGH